MAPCAVDDAAALERELAGEPFDQPDGEMSRYWPCRGREHSAHTAPANDSELQAIGAQLDKEPMDLPAESARRRSVEGEDVDECGLLMRTVCGACLSQRRLGADELSEHSVLDIG